MTVFQLRIVLLTARHGSISAAAAEMGIPQPNASSGIKAIEKELGFDIFVRSRSGITLTDKGKVFMEHAQRIITETERINRLSGMGELLRLRVGCTSYYRGREAFVRFCSIHKDAEDADLRYYNVSFEQGMQMLEEHKIDVLTGLAIDSLMPIIDEMAREHKLYCEEIADTFGSVTFSRNHPVVQNGLFENGIDLKVLSRYPYVAYQALTSDFDTAHYKAIFPIPNKYTIYVEERETRFKIVRDSHAFMMGGEQPQEILDEYGLDQYRLENNAGKVVCMTRRADKDLDEIREFIELVKDVQK